MEDSDNKPHEDVNLGEDDGMFTDVQTVEYTGHSPEKPILKDAKTGKFIKGTGSSGKGGRPKGAKDRVSKAMVDLATELVADRGRELFHEMADRDPAQALALVSKIISPEELRAVYAEERAEQESTTQEVRISLISKAPSQAPQLPTKPASNLPMPDPVPPHQDLHIGSETPFLSGPEPSESTFEGTVPIEGELEQADRAEVEAIRERNERIRAHGGRVGPKRRDRSNEIQYPDDPNIV